ncbi:unnamed protein product [Didymodactylos carnosus]|uniref:CxC5 like cysteine cluster associated with KDZ domain-containing protein n=1 Tax=Didymodactylos carnosus TaxID=1234261 RepID=A0A814IJ06_9BILA|nr:unnamed protein product [Didymodactylos carnosus]CAF1075641.1 unnamed protein product [Didymodactylos carnosus]CAF3795965.1 unnamed protein product [Didymodactylos carnosus]CAF3839413.1 unnamed protein product [Didymodactylos carnosus]
MSYCKTCKISYYSCRYEKEAVKLKYVTATSIKNSKYICLGGKIVFHQILFETFTSQLILAHSSFEGFCAAYNRTIAMTKLPEQVQQQPKMDQKLFQNRWFTYELANVNNI